MKDDKIALCANDIQAASASGKINLEGQIRAYDLLEELLEAPEGLENVAGCDASAAFRKAYEAVAERLPELFDEAALKAEMQAALKPLKEAMNETRFEAAAAASLHEFAKATFETWQTAGIFARRRALRDLRDRAGFRLESHRIGNYVAKTYDLMNEAQSRFAKAQQKVFAADMTYKCKSEAYTRIYNALFGRKSQKQV